MIGVSRTGGGIEAGANHVGAPERAEVEVTPEVMVCGQGVGAAGDGVTAGEVVTRPGVQLAPVVGLR